MHGSFHTFVMLRSDVYLDVFPRVACLFDYNPFELPHLLEKNRVLFGTANIKDKSPNPIIMITSYLKSRWFIIFLLFDIHQDTATHESEANHSWIACSKPTMVYIRTKRKCYQNIMSTVTSSRTWTYGTF